jgi:hypothetical protein
MMSHDSWRNGFDELKLADDESRRLASLTALVNGVVFSLMPLLVMLVGSTLAQESSTSTIVRPQGAPPVWLVAVWTWRQGWPALLPLSFIAGWRTFVHARRWLITSDRSWRGVFEAGICGFLCAMPILAPGIVTQSTKAPPYILVYGGLGAIIGLIVGLVLRTTALSTLWMSRRVVNTGG